MFEKYRFVKVLNEGDYSTVFLVEHRKLGCFRVVKRISKRCRHYERLMNEADILKNLCHPNIPIIYDVEEDEEYSYIIEEYLEGESLKAFRVYQKCVREDEVVDIANQICILFQLLHSTKNPILYLDLKPDNIIISHGRIKLIDFGASVYLNESDKREVSFGTVGYCAPEQYGMHEVDERSDIYGIGAIMYYLMTGQPFTDKAVSGRRMDAQGEYSPALKKVALKCLRRNPKQRYQGVGQLVEELAKLKQSLPSNKPLTIAVSGTRRGMGASHVCLLLASYLNRYVGDAVYVDKSEGRVVPSILKRQEDWKLRGRTVAVGHCALCLDDGWDDGGTGASPIRVMDYGVARPELKEEFEKSERIVIVAGAKEWEYQDTSECMEEFFEYKDIVYVLNHADEKQLKKAGQIWTGRELLSAPHWPDPFEVGDAVELKALAEGILREKRHAKRYGEEKTGGWLWKRR